MSAPDPAKKLSALLKKLRATYGESAVDKSGEGRPPEIDPLIWQLVFSFLSWESSVARAATVSRKLHTAVVDYNEMRVCLANELATLIGDRYPRGLERASRLRSTLNDLYRREHSVTLVTVAAMPKREARVYLESLDGTPGYVASRLLLVSLGGHAFPVDDRIYQTLLEEDAIPPDLSLADAAGWLERHFRAGDALPAYLLVEQWLNDRPPAKAPARKEPAALPQPAETSKAKPDAPADDPAKPADARPAGRRPADKAKPPRPKKAAKD